MKRAYVRMLAIAKIFVPNAWCMTARPRVHVIDVLTRKKCVSDKATAENGISGANDCYESRRQEASPCVCSW